MIVLLVDAVPVESALGVQEGKIQVVLLLVDAAAGPTRSLFSPIEQLEPEQEDAVPLPVAVSGYQLNAITSEAAALLVTSISTCVSELLLLATCLETFSEQSLVLTQE